MANKLVFTMKGRIVLNGKEIGRYECIYGKASPRGGMRLIGVDVTAFDDREPRHCLKMKDAKRDILNRLRAGGLGRLASQGIAA